MTGFSRVACCGMALAALCGCGAPTPPPAAPAAKTAPATDQLNRMVEHYWDERLSTENAIAPQVLADALSIERRYLAEIVSVPRDGLDARSRLTYDIFKRQREISIEGFTYPSELLPLKPFNGVPQQFAAEAAQLAARPATAAAAYANWLKRIDEYLRWTQQAIVNMREGVRRGYTSPRAVIEHLLPALERLGVDDSANVFYGPLRSMPDGIPAAERGQLSREISGRVANQLLPANRALRDFLQNEYLPRARGSLALSELPLGSQWYAYRVKRATDSALSPEEINRIAVAEVARLGPAAARPTARPPVDGLVNGYRELQTQIQSALPTQFNALPMGELEIQPADGLPAPATPLYYRRGGANGNPPAVLYVNTGKGAAAEVSIAAFLQQALPGRHFQRALQQEQAGLPKFRRFGSDRAFSEGWSLYAVSLGDALGVAGDEAAKIESLAAQQRCAVAAVVDTSLQIKGWTRAQAFDYLHGHLSIEDSDAQALIDSYAANPGDALACMVGDDKIRALRARAQQVLGGRFDVREFHAELLQDGAMPLDILETKMKAWMDASK